MEPLDKCIWELLWDYDPNGMVAVDRDEIIRFVNPAFCRLFRTTEDAAIGLHSTLLLGETPEFQRAWSSLEVQRAEREFPDFGFAARALVFAIPSTDFAACVLVDLTTEWNERKEMNSLQRETIAKVNEVVDNQMKVAQEIASLLGEVTAETKASLLKLVRMIEREDTPGGQLP
ncbi:MAG: PAS domain-containing protein [Capsulimonadaceae bacterium]|nr:PAS domain-containing protein [Capsulimonadaceae bacterium]